MILNIIEDFREPMKTDIQYISGKFRYMGPHLLFPDDVFFQIRSNANGFFMNAFTKLIDSASGYTAGDYQFLINQFAYVQIYRLACQAEFARGMGYKVFLVPSGQAFQKKTIDF